jgi:hypothetical protein
MMADARQVARWIVVDIVADILGRNRFSQSLRHNSAGESQHAKQVNDSAEPAKAEFDIKEVNGQKVSEAMTPLEQGAKAFSDGEPLINNPYLRYTHDWDLWNEGWRDEWWRTATWRPR